MKEYPVKYRGRLLLTGLLVFMVHSAKLHSGIVGIDTEDLIHLQDGFYGGWLHTGRQGLVLLKYLLGNKGFNPYFSGVMTLLLFTAATAAFMLLWDMFSGREDKDGSIWAWAFGGLLWISHPVMAEQFYFSLQSLEICLAMVLTACALYLSFRWESRRHPAFAAGAFALLLVTFSSYQSFVVLYIFGVVTVLLLQGLKTVAEEPGAAVGDLLKRIIPYCIIFIAAFLVNTLITRFFFSSSDYLQNQILWGNAPVKDCLHAIAGHVVKAFTGNDSVFYNAGLGIFALYDFILLMLFLRKQGRGSRGVSGVIVFFYLALLATLFMMSVLLGGTPAMRSQLTLPAVTGFLGYFSIRLPRLAGAASPKRGFLDVKFFFAGAVLICLISGMAQAKTTLSLYYTDMCRYEQDAALGRAIIDRIRQVDHRADGLPVIVVGGREFSGNNACVVGEVIGRSFFNYDREVEPAAFWSTRRVLGFLHTLGADFNQVPTSRIEEALEYSTYMPEWPAIDSVQEKDGMIIIKLSNYLDD